MSYSPAIGRFLEQDPAGYINGPNTYQLELSNPVDSLDPSGEVTIGPGNTITVQEGDTPGGIARQLTGNFDEWQQVFPDLTDPTELQIGTYNVDPAIMQQYYKNHPPANQPQPPAQPPAQAPAPKPAPKPAPANATPKPDANGVIKKKMWVTAYDVNGLTSDGKQTCPGTIASQDTYWRKKPNTKRGDGEYRDCPKGTGAKPAFPYGTKVTIYNDDGSVLYTGTIEDTGRGGIRNGIPADDWLDIWLADPTKAKQFGLKQYNVELTPPTAK